jgi:N-acetylglucosaminyl-diphospho-decaprenol L-rhamnosyltransferase
LSLPAPLAVVVVSFESRGCLGACLDSLTRHAPFPLEVVVVDNASADGSADLARQRDPALRLIANPTNVGFARACNQGTRATRAPLVLFLNPDAEVTAGALEAMVTRLESSPDVGAVGPLTVGAEGIVQVSTGPDLTLAAERRQRRLVRGVRQRDPRAMAAASDRHSHEHEPDWVSGACLLARRAALDAVGGFDEDFFLYEEDADLCRRLRAAGWRVVFTPEARVVHRLGQSMARAPAPSRAAYDRSHLRYYRKHNGLLQQAGLRALLATRALASRDPRLLRLALGRA